MDRSDEGLDFLAHHGILGMHWGIRKLESDIREGRKKQAIIESGASAAAAAILGTAAFKIGKPIVQLNNAVDRLSEEFMTAPKVANAALKGHDLLNADTDIVLPKGTVFHRVASELENEVNNPKYATYFENDVLRYRKDWSALSGNGVDHFKTKFEALDNAKIASRGTMHQVGLSILDKVPEEGGKTLRQLAIDQAVEFQKQGWPHKAPDVFALTKTYTEATPEEIVNHIIGSGNGGSWTGAAESRLVSALKKLGYAGFTDNIDTSWLADHAVVLINNEVVKTSSSPLTSIERDAAKKLITKLAVGALHDI